jgi:hypothetical protein
MKTMKLAMKTIMILALVILSGLLLISESEFSRRDYASAAVPPPRPDQKKVVLKNLRMA